MNFDAKAKTEIKNTALLQSERRRLLVQYKAPNFILNQLYDDGQNEGNLDVHPSVLRGLLRLWHEKIKGNHAANEIVSDIRPYLGSFDG